jgi:hypothetical protein
VVNVVSVVINVFIVVKVKCVNSGNISDICDKLNFTTSYIHFTTTNTNFIKTHTNITIFDTFSGTVPLRDLRISHLSDMKQKGLVIIEIILCNAMAI